VIEVGRSREPNHAVRPDRNREFGRRIETKVIDRRAIVEAPRLNSGVDVLNELECRRLLGTELVGRLGVTIDGKPEIFPVNFALAGEDVVMRTDSGSKSAAALRGPVVFEVDHFDSTDRSGWSVMVHGSAQVETGRTGRPGSQSRVLTSWLEAHLPHLLRITATEVTGRRITDHAAQLRPVPTTTE
jgi:uncharacterized protein